MMKIDYTVIALDGSLITEVRVSLQELEVF